jgi:sigma-B regulation protein RsbU (phosphoserine phosphatase)
VTVGGQAGLRHGTRVLALLAVLAVIAALAVAGYSALQANHAAKERADRLDPAETSAAELLTAFVEERSAVRGYLLTSSAAQGPGPAYATATAEIRDRTTRLRTLVDRFPALLDQIDTVTASYQGWQRNVVQPELDAMAAGQPATARAWALSTDGGPGGDTFFAQLQTDIDALTRAIRGEQSEAAAEVKDSAGLLLISGATVVAMLLAMAMLLLVVSRRWLIAPLNALRSAVNAVAAGRYDTTIPAVGPREIVDLASNVEAMRAQLVTLVRQNERSWEALAQEGPAVLALRDALTPSSIGDTVGLQLRGRLDPAEGALAGDWFDAIEIPDGRVAVVVGDVAGHGAVSGVFALRLKQLLTVALTRGMEPGTALQWVVEALGDTGETFATALVALVDPHGGEVVYANAGHPDALVLRAGRFGAAAGARPLAHAHSGARPAEPGPFGELPDHPDLDNVDELDDPDDEADAVDDLAGLRGFVAFDRFDELDELDELAAPARGRLLDGLDTVADRPGADALDDLDRLAGLGTVEPLASTGPLLSSLVAEPGAWRVGRLRLGPGDVLFVYTDGLVEARDAGGELFGRHRLVDELVRVTDRAPGLLLDDVFAAVRQHAPGRPSDDRTAIALSLRPPAAAARPRF